MSRLKFVPGASRIRNRGADHSTMKFSKPLLPLHTLHLHDRFIHEGSETYCCVCRRGPPEDHQDSLTWNVGSLCCVLQETALYEDLEVEGKHCLISELQTCQLPPVYGRWRSTSGTSHLDCSLITVTLFSTRIVTELDCSFIPPNKRTFLGAFAKLRKVT